MSSLNQPNSRPVSEAAIVKTLGQVNAPRLLAASPWRRISALMCLLMLGTTVSFNSLAHRQHFSWTDISFNNSSNQIQIVHRVHAHDAIQLLEFDEETSIDLTNATIQAKFALYIAGQFQLELEDHSASIELIGVELEGNYIFVYQETSLHKPPKKLRVHSTIFQNLFSDQLNIVNLNLDGQTTQSLEFRNKSTPKYFQWQIDESMGEVNANSH